MPPLQFSLVVYLLICLGVAKGHIELKLFTANPAVQTYIQTVSEGSLIDLKDTGTVLSIVASTNYTGTVSKVVFVYDNYNYTAVKAPYAMDGGTALRLNPVYYLAFSGYKYLTVTFYDTTGGILDSQIITFSVVQSPLPLPSTQSNIPFIEKNGLIVMEVESVPLVNPWIYEKDIVPFSGSGYYRFNGNQYSFGSVKGALKYQIKIETLGKYQLMIRALKTHPDTTWSNDCFVKMTGPGGFASPLVKLFFPAGRYKWNYASTTDIDHVLGKQFYTITEPGIYEFEVSGRSKNFHMDHIVLFKTKQYTKDSISQMQLVESARGV